MKISTLRFLGLVAMFFCGYNFHALVKNPFPYDFSGIIQMALIIICLIGCMYFDFKASAVEEKIRDLERAGYRCMCQSEINRCSKYDLDKCIKVDGSYYIKKRN